MSTRSRNTVPFGWRELRDGEVVSEDDMFFAFGLQEKLEICKGNSSLVGLPYSSHDCNMHIRKGPSKISQYTFE